MKRFKFGREEFGMLGSDDEELQSKFDIIVVTAKLMGYEIRYGRRFNTMFEELIGYFTRIDYEIIISAKAYGNHIDNVGIEIYERSLESKIKKKFEYSRRENKVEDLYEILDKVLIYI